MSQIEILNNGETLYTHRNKINNNFASIDDTHLLNTGKLTNCILEIPQDIIIVGSANKITLKENSKLTIPNGVSSNIKQFTTRTLNNDIVKQNLTEPLGHYVVFFDTQNNQILLSDNLDSGTTPVDNTIYYNTSTNYIKAVTGQTVSQQNYSFPLAQIYIDSSKNVTVEQIYNGFGYIGKTLFMLPNISMLLSDGRNTSGTLKSKYVKNLNTKVLTTSLQSSDTLYLFYSDTQDSLITESKYVINSYKPNNDNCMWLDTHENIMYKITNNVTEKYSCVYIGLFNQSNGKIQNVELQQTVEFLNKFNIPQATEQLTGALRITDKDDELDDNCTDAAITPSSLYELNNYRLASTTYEVDDVVGCPFHSNLQLKCTTAGTTSSQPLDTHPIENADTITDGTVTWEVQKVGVGGGLEVGDIGISLFVDESKGLRRYLNGSLLTINSNSQVFLNKLKQISLIYPSILCTETEWQEIVNNSAFAQCGKFVINEQAGTIRLPKIIMPIQGLTDLSKLGELVEQKLPNITGESAQRELIGADGSYAMGTFGFDASRSSSIYQDGANVQQEQIQYPYFIQIATGQETEVDIVNTIELNNPYSLFDCKFADHLLENTSWLRADEFNWYSGDVYVDAYNKLVEEYNNSTQETWGDGIVVNRSANGFKITTKEHEDKVLTRYNKSIDCWIYILDTENKRFKLPRTKWGFKGLRNRVGDGIAESLPNINGSFVCEVGNSVAKGYLTGAFYDGGAVSTAAGTNGGSTDRLLRFDASGSSSTYQDNAPVQERGTQMYLYFYVGETVQNANLINAGRIQEQLVGKVDIDANNFNEYGKSFISSLSLPSDRYTDLTLGATDTSYIAPANGYFFFEKVSSASGQYVNMQCMNENDNYLYGFEVNATASGNYTRLTIPVKKGYKVMIGYNLGGTTRYFRFVYAEGEK